MGWKDFKGEGGKEKGEGEGAEGREGLREGGTRREGESWRRTCT